MERCRFEGYSECRVDVLRASREKKLHLLKGVGESIEISRDPQNLNELAEIASNIQSGIDATNRELSSFNPCLTCRHGRRQSKIY